MPRGVPDRGDIPQPKRKREMSENYNPDTVAGFQNWPKPEQKKDYGGFRILSVCLFVLLFFTWWEMIEQRERASELEDLLWAYDEILQPTEPELDAIYDQVFRIENMRRDAHHPESPRGPGPF